MFGFFLFCASIILKNFFQLQLILSLGGGGGHFGQFYKGQANVWGWLAAVTAGNDYLRVCSVLDNQSMA